MTVISFPAPTTRARIGTGPPPSPASAAATGSFSSPSGRSGAFTGSYRLERFVPRCGHLAAAGVFTGQLIDAEGSRIGNGARRQTAAVKELVSGNPLLIRIGPLNVDLLGFLVTVDELSVDLGEMFCEDAVREALRLLVESAVATSGHPVRR